MPNTSENEFTVTWAIQVSGKTAEEAAKNAREIMLDPTSTATLFQVTSSDGITTDLELEYPYIESEIEDDK